MLPTLLEPNQFLACTPITTTATLILILALGWIVWLRPLLERKKPHPSIPMIPNSHWLFGHLFWLLRLRYLEKQQALVDHADGRGRCSVWMGPVPSICLTAPADAHKLLLNHHARRNLPIFKYHFERLTGPKNLLMLNGKEWKYYQSALKAALSKSDPLLLQSITQDTTEALTRNLKLKIVETNNGSPIAIKSIESLMKMITMDVFGRTAFSHDFGCCSALELCPFARAFELMEEDIFDRCKKRTLWPQNLLYWIPTQRNSKFNKKRSLFRGFLMEIVQERRRGDKKTNDILKKIIQTHAKAAVFNNTDSQVTTLSDEDLIDILSSVLVAGYDTVSTSLTYAIYLLSRYPEWERECVEEVRKAINNHQSSPTNQLELPTSRGVIMEALRLYPVATGTSRTLEKPLALDGGVIIPKGYHTGVSFWLIHRSERYFPNPLEFRPDRWIASPHPNTPSDIPAGDSKAFFAFSGGARACPGQHFALNEATLALAWLIKDLRFQIDPDYDVEIEWKAIVQKPKGGIPATVSIRK